MLTNQIMFIISTSLTSLLFITLIALFFISRKSQKTMKSMLTIITNPDRAKVQDATRVLNLILADEISKIETSFKTMRDTLDAQIKYAVDLKNELSTQNEKLVSTARDANQRMSETSEKIESTLNNLQNAISSDEWKNIDNTTDNFNTKINEIIANVNSVTQDTEGKISQIQSYMDTWISSGETLSAHLGAEIENNTKQTKTLTEETENLQQKLSNLTQSVTENFTNVKSAAANYESVMQHNDKLMDGCLVKLDSFSKQSKKQLTSQMNTLTNTANVVAGQVRLAESSIEQQIRKLTDAVETLMNSSSTTETSVRGISNELATLTNRFDGEIKEFANGVVSELKTVSGVANITLENTRSAANAFSESVKTMATGVRETLIEMNTAHTQLSGQSASLIKMSADTTAQLQPLSELIEKYYSALPDLSKNSVDAGETLQKIVANLNDKIALMKSTVSESTATISDSAIKLEDLAGQSRQQMIDLMSDYAKAVNTMQTLNKQMMVARASAPMDAISVAPAAHNYGRVSGQDFLKQSEKIFEKLYEQSKDLTQVLGADIPDVVWKKYHAGDNTIFSKWLAKMLNAADKKQIKSTIKNDNVFKTQSVQFVRSFDKILEGAKSADNPDRLAATLIKTDLGQIYSILKNYI